MKTVLIFSNPFGYGPAGKAVSIGRYIQANTHGTNVFLCGTKNLLSITGSKLPTIEVDDRNEEAISAVLSSVNGDKYVVSSQNRFAIKAAKNRNIPTAFLDGLAWFWTSIPADHFLADIIFWINYPGIRAKIPTDYADKIEVIGGITETIATNMVAKRQGITFYLGGCKNPLTPMPVAYLDLTAKLLEDAVAQSLPISISTDLESQTYLQKSDILQSRMKISKHADFMKRIARSELFVTNGGQTAATEAIYLQTPIIFYLTINLSQMALINKVLADNPQYPILAWADYIRLPDSLAQFSEKQAIEFFEVAARNVLGDKQLLSKMRYDFLRFLRPSPQNLQPKVLTMVGSTGAEDIYKVLQTKWKLI